MCFIRNINILHTLLLMVICRKWVTPKQLYYELQNLVINIFVMLMWRFFFTVLHFVLSGQIKTKTTCS